MGFCEVFYEMELYEISFYTHAQTLSPTLYAHNKLATRLTGESVTQTVFANCLIEAIHVCDSKYQLCVDHLFEPRAQITRKDELISGALVNMHLQKNKGARTSQNKHR